MTLSPALKVPLGVLGGWLAIMAPAVVTIALRLREFDPSGLPSTYALTLALGWLTMIVALIAAGVFGDTIHRRTSTRAPLARIGVPLIAAGGVLLALAPSPTWLAAVWVGVQIPSAMVITTALAEGGEEVSSRRRGLASGLVGAAPIIALLVGGIAVRVLSDSLAWAFVIPAIVGALVAAPLMAIGGDVDPEEVGNSTPPAGRGQSPNSASTLWLTFLAGSFLLAWATATTNSFLVTFVQYVVDALSGDVTDLSSSAVILASILAILSSIAGGVLTVKRSRAIRLWIMAAALCALALTILVATPTSSTLLISACVFGVAFGAANGVELSVVLFVRERRDRLGRDFGILTAVTSAPYVLVPALAAVALRTNVEEGVILLFTIACALSAVAALVVAVTALRQSRPTSTHETFTGNSFKTR